MAQGSPSRSWLVRFLAGGWVATLVAFAGWSPISSARAQDAAPLPLPLPLPLPAPPPGPPPGSNFDPLDPTSPGQSVTPPGGVQRGMPNPGLGGAGFNNR